MTANPSAMSERIDRLVAEIEAGLQSETNEERLLSILRANLEALRRLYRVDQTTFARDQLERLQWAKTVTDALDEFVDLGEELEAVALPIDAREIRRSLQSVARCIGQLPVQKRVLCELRRLGERMPELAQRAEQLSSNARSMTVTRLEQQAPPCRVCGHPMVIRESRFGEFWGCRSFPRCFGRRQLIASERRALHACESTR